jgi:hypothetical protein
VLISLCCERQYCFALLIISVIRIWPEVLPRIGVHESDLVNGPNTFTKSVQVLMVNGSPKKVIGLAAASFGDSQKVPANGEPYYAPPDLPPPPPENGMPF